MKKFFKKIAFVSAMAMVVSAMPAQSAAAAEGPQMSKWVGFYLGGDASGTYSDEAKYAKVWNWKDDYVSVSFESSNPEVATVTAKKGKVTPLSVGTTTITATFTDADGETVDKTCKVTVKKNAVEAGISDNSAASLKDLTIGDVFQTKTYRLGADGEKTWKGKTVITDGVRFASSDENVFTVTSTTGKVTAVGAGEAKLSVWAVQTEKPVVDEATGKSVYRPTTDVVKYDVVVKSAGILEANQTSLTTVELTTDCEDAAKAITAENLTVEYYLGENLITDFIKSVAVSADDAKKVVVTLHNAMVTDRTYVITYGEQKFDVKGAATTVADITVPAATAEIENEVFIPVDFYNAAGIKVGTTTDTTYATSGVVLTAPESEKGDYYLDSTTGKIWFFNPNVTVEVTATYDMGFDDYGNELTDIVRKGFVTSVPHASTTTTNVEGWALGATGLTDDALANLPYATSVLKVAVGDSDYYLYGRYTSTTGTTATKEYTSEQANYSYSSSNENVLLVNGNQLLPVAAGNAQVIVKDPDADNKVVGVANVSVAADRHLDTVDVAVTGEKISTDVTSAKFVVTAKDQLGAPIAVTVTVKQTNKTEAGLTVASEALVPAGAAVAAALDGENAFYVESTRAENSAVAAYVQVIVTAGTVTKTVNKVVYAKTANATVASYKVVASQGEIDTKLAADKAVANYASALTLDTYDSDGYKIGTETVEGTLTAAPATTATGGFYLVVTKGTTDISKFVSDGSFAAFTGIDKAPVGLYVVRAYEVTADAKVKALNSTTINVKDTTSSIVVTQDKKAVASLDAAGVFDALTFKRDNTDIKASLAAVSIDVSNQNASSVFVKTITVTETVGTLTYNWTLNVNKLFSLAE